VSHSEEIYAIEDWQDGQLTLRPCYTCGHCSMVILLDAQRTRDRVRCAKCDRLLCEKNELCMKDCTPIHSLAADHLESALKWQKYLPAIMAGSQNEEEARAAGLIKEF
jgi:hypothetical protein